MPAFLMFYNDESPVIGAPRSHRLRLHALFTTAGREGQNRPVFLIENICIYLLQMSCVCVKSLP